MLKGVLDGRGNVLREFASGVGYVDIGIFLSTLHIVEMKILKTGALVGPAQLDQYLRNEGRTEGWLVVMDARRPDRKPPLPGVVRLTGRRIAHVIVVDINPRPPSRFAV